MIDSNYLCIYYLEQMFKNSSTGTLLCTVRTMRTVIQPEVPDPLDPGP